jgi:adenosylmethionine-8-amino-7-oxononanoate aminotransferase
MAKGITSGYLPLSATAVRKDIYEQFRDMEKADHFRHVNTFGGNPAACALALRNLEIMEREQLVERSRMLGERLAEQLEELLDHPLVGDIRSFGFLMGIELVADKKTKEPAPPAAIAGIMAACKAAGLIVGRNSETVAGYNNVLTICPPLSSTDEDFDFIVSTVKRVMNLA